MYLDPSEARPHSLFDAQPLDTRALAMGAGIAAGIHVGLPLAIAAVLATAAAIGITLDSPPPPPPPLENVIQAHFIQRGEILDPHQLPDRQVPILRTDVPDPHAAPSLDPNPPPPAPRPDHERQRQAVDDVLQRLSEDAQIFAERDEQRMREGDPDGIEGGERHASEGDRYVGILAGFFRRGWSVPTTIPDSELSGLHVVVMVTIGADTTISHWELRGSSGNPDFDESVRAQMTRIEQTSPNIPAPPEEVASQYLGQVRPFNFRGQDAHR